MTAPRPGEARRTTSLKALSAASQSALCLVATLSAAGVLAGYFDGTAWMGRVAVAASAGAVIAAACLYAKWRPAAALAIAGVGLMLLLMYLLYSSRTSAGVPGPAAL